MPRSIALSAALLVLLSSCFLHRYAQGTVAGDPQADQRASAKSAARHSHMRKTSPFDYGRTHDSVLAAITDRSEILVAEFTQPRGHLAVYQYYRYGKARHKDAGYYLYFMNDTLIRKSSPENLETGAKTAVQEYYNKRED